MTYLIIFWAVINWANGAAASSQQAIPFNSAATCEAARIVFLDQYRAKRGSLDNLIIFCSER